MGKVLAQARQLKQEGQNINQIAYKVSLSMETMNQYLGLVDQKQE
jgi:orotate phosphoribosyltransferase-like protein